jgi:uncharacterized protein (DUF2235 family)
MEIDRHASKQRLHQRWFPGDHSDIGGGHAEGGLWKCSFEWMLRGAYNAGLHVDQNMYDTIMGNQTDPWKQPKHDILTGFWKVFEYVPKKKWDYEDKRWRYSCNRGRSRYIPKGSVIDRSAMLRTKNQIDGYSPRNFSEDFTKYIATSAEASLTYEWQIPPEPTIIPDPLDGKQWPPS